MKHFSKVFALVCLFTRGAQAQSHLASETTNYLGFVTNAPAVWESWSVTRVFTNPVPTNLPPRFATNATYLRHLTREFTFTNSAFRSFLPDTLNHLVWTNYLATTNGRDLRIWSQRTHPTNWPAKPPEVKWNPNCILWGMKGFTALSPCWQGEGAPGQVPLTLLTRRHAYTRGHGFGPDGFNTYTAGSKAWFLTADNSLIEVRVKRAATRITLGSAKQHRDYTLLLFDRDLPGTIEPMAVASPEDYAKYLLAPASGNVPRPFFQTEQTGLVGTGVPPLTVNTWKGGDSGSPNMIPLPGELVFVSGRSTTGPCPDMQADMDELCRLEKLNPAKYQLHWVDLQKMVPH